MPMVMNCHCVSPCTRHGPESVRGHEVRTLASPASATGRTRSAGCHPCPRSGLGLGLGVG
eukprot:scaffold27710_cov62-Phaeocystis_antarctica.AAC.2